MPGPASTGLLIYASDVQRVSAFYEGVLGARLLDADADRRVIESPDVQILIYAFPAEHAAEVVVTRPPVPRDRQAIKPFFTVDSLAAAEALVEQLGGVVWGPIWPGPGLRVRNACDPEGNIVHLRERVV